MKNKSKVSRKQMSGRFSSINLREINNKYFYEKFFDNQKLLSCEVFMSRLLNKLSVPCMETSSIDSGCRRCLCSSVVTDDVVDFFTLYEIGGSKTYDNFTPETVIARLEEFCAQNPNYCFNKKELMKTLNNIGFIDLMFLNSDRHANNIMFVCKQNKEKIEIQVAPLIDNEYSINEVPHNHKYYVDDFDYLDFANACRDSDGGKTVLISNFIFKEIKNQYGSQHIAVPDFKYISKDLFDKLMNLDIGKEYEKFKSATGLEIDDFSDFKIYYRNVSSFFKKEFLKQTNKSYAEDEQLCL